MLGDTGIAVHPGDERYATLVGQDRHASVRRARDPDRRRRRDRPGVRDRRREGHAGARPDRLRHRAADRAAAHEHLQRRRDRQRERGRRSSTGSDATTRAIAVREALEKLDLIVEEIRPYVHSVGHCYRCHSEIEPWIAGLQWFVAVDALRGPAKEAALDGRITFWPERWQQAYVGWLDNLRDWNISRQLWWGHRIPAWYCPDGHVTVAGEDPDACADVRVGRRSSRTPTSSTRGSRRSCGRTRRSGWPDDTEDLRFFYPNTVLVTGYEILYLWVARMIMSGMSLDGRRAVPQRGDPRPGARRARPEDVEVARQRDRSDRDDRSLRRRRAAVLARALGDRRTAGHPARRWSRSRVRATSRTRSGTRRGWCSAPIRAASPQLPPRRAADRLRPLAALAPPGLPWPRSTPRSTRTSSPRPRRRCTGSCGRSSATGAWRCRRGGSTAEGADRQDAANVLAWVLGADAAAAAPGHAVRHRGDLAAVRDRAVDLDRALAGAAPGRPSTRTRRPRSPSSRTSSRRSGSSARGTASRRR